MNNENFEKRLEQQPLRQIPAIWRQDILNAARAAAISKRPATQPSLLSNLNSQLSTLLWPSPKAWAGLAAVWLVIFALNFSARDETRVLVKQVLPPSPELIMALEKQRRELAELVGLSTPIDADRVKSFAPRPRSNRRDDVRNV